MGIGKISIKPTTHYLTDHSDVSWDLVMIEVHAERDQQEEIIWVINAFKMQR